MLRMSLVMGLEPVQVDALAVEPLSDENQCLVDGVEPKSDMENFIWFWVGIIICVSVVAWIVFGIVMCRKLYKIGSDLNHCWNQVADEDDYIAGVEDRVTRLEMLNRHAGTAIEQVSNQHSMTTDYVMGLRYGLVEQGGFVRSVDGVTDVQWRHMQATERGNLVAHNVMGSSAYLQLVRQRAERFEGDDTDDPMNLQETGEEEEIEVGPISTTMRGENSLESPAGRIFWMIEWFRDEINNAIARGGFSDTASMQTIVVIALGVTRKGPTEQDADEVQRRIDVCFLELAIRARREGRQLAADIYEAFGEDQREV